MQRASTSPKPRWPLVVVSVIFVVVAAIGVYAFLWDQDQNPEIIVRDDPVADLLGWIPATDETKASFAVWTPDRAASAPGTVIPVDEMHGERLALEPFPDMIGYEPNWGSLFGYSAVEVTGWAVGGAEDQVEVFTGTFNQNAISEQLRANGYKRTDYRGAQLFTWDGPETGGSTNPMPAGLFGLLGNRIIAAGSVDLVKSAIDAAVGKRPSLAEDEHVDALLKSIAPSTALMVVDTAKHAVACAGGSGTAVEPSGQYVAVAYGRIGEGGDPRTFVATSFESEDEATEAEAAYDLGWQDGYVLAGNSGAPISNFAKVNFVSQSENLLIAELVDGREEGWTRAAIRFATPVCEVVSETLPDSAVATPQIEEPSALSRALGSLPDPGMEGATLAADFNAASKAAGATAPEDLNIRADDIEAWLAKLGPIPTFDVFPTDTLKLSRWPETLGISLGSILAISETHGANEEQTIAVLVGTWDPDMVEEHLGQLGFLRTDYGETTIYTFTGSLEDPSHELNRATDGTWTHVALLGDRIYVSPSSRRLREVLDIVTGDDPAPQPPGDVYLRDRMLAGKAGVTMVEIVGREFMNELCVDLNVSGVTPDWYGASAQWTTTADGGFGEVVLMPESGRPLSDIQQDFEKQVLSEGAPEDAMAVPSANPFAEAFGFQRIGVGQLVDGTTALVATFSPPADESTARFFSRSLEGCRFGTP